MQMQLYSTLLFPLFDFDKSAVVFFFTFQIALRSGRRGRGFESRRFDCIEESLKTLCVQAFFALEIIDKTGVSR